VSRRPRYRLTLWPLAVLAVLVLVGCLVAGCDPYEEPPSLPGTVEVNVSPGPDGPVVSGREAS
jgi:hypothetical protein